MCVLIKDTGRRLPFELHCSLYQGQQGDVNQSVRGNYITRFCGGQNMMALADMLCYWLPHDIVLWLTARRTGAFVALNPGIACTR